MKTQSNRGKKLRRATPRVRQPARARTAAIDIDANRRLLNRYRFVAHEGMLILAGWLPKAETFELKCEMGRALWESAQHVNALFLRLREIQSPAFQKPSDPALVTLLAELLHAPDENQEEIPPESE